MALFLSCALLVSCGVGDADRSSELDEVGIDYALHHADRKAKGTAQVEYLDPQLVMIKKEVRLPWRSSTLYFSEGATIVMTARSPNRPASTLQCFWHASYRSRGMMRGGNSDQGQCGFREELRATR